MMEAADWRDEGQTWVMGSMLVAGQDAPAYAFSLMSTLSKIDMVHQKRSWHMHANPPLVKTYGVNLYSSIRLHHALHPACVLNHPDSHLDLSYNHLHPYNLISLAYQSVFSIRNVRALTAGGQVSSSATTCPMSMSTSDTKSAKAECASRRGPGVRAGAEQHLLRRTHDLAPTAEKLFVLGVSTGTSPIATYNHLIKVMKEGTLS